MPTTHTIRSGGGAAAAYVSDVSYIGPQPRERCDVCGGLRPTHRVDWQEADCDTWPDDFGSYYAHRGCIFSRLRMEG